MPILHRFVMHIPTLVIFLNIFAHVVAAHIFTKRTYYSSHSCLSQNALICNFRKTSGNSVRGYVLFTPTFRGWRTSTYGCRVRIEAHVRGLSVGAHGFHIHMYGDERKRDGSSVGDHFNNPEDIAVAHGYPMDTARHWGDFGNLIANSQGIANYRRIDRLISLPGILGRGMVVHADKDQGAASQPSGNSGQRLATCVIGIANPDLPRT